MNRLAGSRVAATIVAGALLLDPDGAAASALLMIAVAALVFGVARNRPLPTGSRVAAVALGLFLVGWGLAHLDERRVRRGGPAAAARLAEARRDQVARGLEDRIGADRAMAVRVSSALEAEVARSGVSITQDPDLFVALDAASPPLLPRGVGIEVYDGSGSLRAWWGDARGGRLPADSVAMVANGSLLRRPAGYTLGYTGVPWVVEADTFVIVVKDVWSVETPLRRGLGETGLILTTLERAADISVDVTPIARQGAPVAEIQDPGGDTAIGFVTSEPLILRRYLAQRHAEIRRLLAALFLLPFLWSLAAVWEVVRRAIREPRWGRYGWFVAVTGQSVVLATVWLFLSRTRVLAELLPDTWFSPLTFASDVLGTGSRSPADLLVTSALIFAGVLSAYTLIPSDRRRPARGWLIPALAAATWLFWVISPTAVAVVEIALENMSQEVFFSPTLLFSPSYLMILMGLALLVASAVGAVAIGLRWLDAPTARPWIIAVATVTIGMIGVAVWSVSKRALTGGLDGVTPLLLVGFMGSAVLADAIGRRTGPRNTTPGVRFSLTAVTLAALITLPVVGHARVQAANELLGERAERIGEASTQWLQYTMTRTIEYLSSSPDVRRVIASSDPDAALLLWNESPLRVLDFASGLYLLDADASIVSQFALSAIDLSGRARRHARDTNTPRIEIEGAVQDQAIWWAIVPLFETVEDESVRVGSAVAMTTEALELREPATGSAFVLTDLLAGSGPTAGASQIVTLAPGEVPAQRTLVTTVDRESGEQVRLAMPLDPLLPGARDYAVFAFVGAIFGIAIGFLERTGDGRARARWWARVRSDNPLRSFRVQLLLAFVAVAAVPLVVYAGLGYRASRAEVVESSRSAAAEALASASRMIAGDPALERGTPRGLTQRLAEIATILQQDIVLYWRGRTIASSRPEIFASRLFADRMPGEVYADLFAVRRPLAFDSTTLGERSFLVAYRPFTDVGAPEGYVLATPLLIREDRARLDLQRLGEGVFLLLAASLAFLFVVSWWVSRYMAQPLSALERGTRQIAAGRLSYRIPAPAQRDEFGRLQQAFNAMAEGLDQSQRALEQEKSRVQAILASVGAGVVAVDESGIVRLFNDRAQDLLGQSSREVIGCSAETLTDSDGAVFWRAVCAAIAGGRGREGELIVQGEGGERHFHFVSAPLKDATGNERGVVVAFEDITANVESQRVLAWGEMARQVAHEIKNPLTPMKLSLQHLERTVDDRAEDLDSILHENIDLILAEIDRLERIAGNFARFAVPDPTTSEPFDAVASTSDVLRLFEPGDEAIDYRVEILGEPAPLRGDEEGYRRILVNLLQNSREAVLAKGSGRIEIRLDWEREPGWARVTVLDDGVGLPEESLDRLFEPSFSTKTRGTGLGLAITRRIVEAWGGTIGYERRPGGGTAIHVRLQIAGSGVA